MVEWTVEQTVAWVALIEPLRDTAESLCAFIEQYEVFGDDMALFRSRMLQKMLEREGFEEPAAVAQQLLSYRDQMLERQRKTVGDSRTVCPQRDQEDQPSRDFLCPMTLCLMKDPWTTMTGSTYEKEEIQVWLRNHTTDPKTNEELSSTTLVPNHTLRSLIREWCDDHPNFEE
jgi:hypothetical protein